VGPVLSRLGDVYGSTVNIASRLTSISRPGWVLVDRAMHDALRDDPRPKLVLWGAEDPIIPLSAGEKFATAIGASAPEPIANAGHFLQEDAGPEIGARIAEWLSSAR